MRGAAAHMMTGHILPRYGHSSGTGPDKDGSCFQRGPALMQAADLSESEPTLVPREDGQYREEPGRRGTLDAVQGDDTAGHTSRTPR